jgi:hypothetical protein
MITLGRPTPEAFELGHHLARELEIPDLFSPFFRTGIHAMDAGFGGNHALTTQVARSGGYEPEIRNQLISRGNHEALSLTDTGYGLALIGGIAINRKFLAPRMEQVAENTWLTTCQDKTTVAIQHHVGWRLMLSWPDMHEFNVTQGLTLDMSDIPSPNANYRTPGTGVYDTQRVEAYTSTLETFNTRQGQVQVPSIRFNPQRSPVHVAKALNGIRY